MATDGFNKGEWSEMYVFIKLIKDNKVYFGNELHKPTNEFVEIIKLSTNGSSTEISRVDDASIAISDKYDSKISKTIKIESIVNGDVLAKIKASIESGNARSFSGPSELIESILTPLGISKLKAEAKVKADITIGFKDNSNNQLYYEQPVGIKSYLGSKPTLINPTGHTKFKYEIKGLGIDVDKINNALIGFDYKSKIQKLIEIGGKISFIDVAEPIYKMNLKKVDSLMPQLLGNTLLSYYSTNRKTKLSYFVNDVTDIIHIKRYLLESMLGIFPSLEWDGKRTCNGSISLMRQGDLLFYHVIKQDIFEEYLFNNTRFDSPQSRGASNYCELYLENDRLFIDLILQIRFS
jgi:DNA (cytosine-5)-methyltransferase 1